MYWLRAPKALSVWVMVGILMLCSSGAVVSAASATGKIPILMWVFPMGDLTRAIYDDFVIPAFEKENPDIELTIVVLPWANRDEKMMLGYISGSGPDIAYLNVDFFPRFVNEGMLEPLDRYYTEEDFRDFLPNAIHAMTSDGQIWGFPIIQSATIPMINATMFRENGLDPNKPPTNWQELEQMGGKLTRRSDNPAQARYGIGWAQNATTTNATFNPFLWSAGGDVFAPDGRSVIWDQPPGIEALDYLTDLHRQGLVGGAFASGNVGIQLANDASLGKILKTSGVSFDWSPGVVIGHKERVTYGTIAGYAMFNTCKNKDAAARVMRFFTSSEIMGRLVGEWGYLGPRRSIRPSIYGEDAGWFVKFMEGAVYTRHDITHPLVREVYKYLAPAVQRAVALQETPQAALELSARAANMYLKENMAP